MHTRTPLFHLTVCMFFCLTVFITNSYASTTQEISLFEAIQRIKRSDHPAIEEQKLEIDAAEVQIDKVRGTFYSPRIKLESYSGVVSDAEGTINNSLDRNDDTDDFGPFFQIGVKIIQPLYSFGKYGNAEKAAVKNLEVRKAIYQESLNNLNLETIRAYIGVTTGRKAIRISDELKDRYHNLLKHIKLLIEEENSDLDESYLLEAKSLHFEIEKQRSAINLNAEQAALYLKALLGLVDDEKIITEDIPLPKLKQDDNLLKELQHYFQEKSPIIESLKSGMTALQYKVKLEGTKHYPDLFLALGAGYGRAPDRDRQTNAFITDDYNYERYGGTLGLKWDYNYFVSKADMRKTLIDYEKTASKKRLALLTKKKMIETLYRETLQKQNLLQVAKQSLSSAKSWLRLEIENSDLGIGDVKRLVKANQNYYQLKGDVITCHHNYLLFLAKLAHEVGNTELFLQWINNGKVQIN